MSKKIELTEELANQIKKLYIENNMTKQEVADTLDIGLSTLSRFFKELNIRKTNEEVSLLRQQTNLKRYGVDNPSKSESVKTLISESNKLNASERVVKSKQTKLDRYGNENYNNTEKSKITKKVKYNNENYNNRDSYKSTMLTKYGVDNYFKLSSCVESNLKKLCENKEYTDLFTSMFNNRDVAIDFLSKNKYSYFKLSELFNAPYYTVQM